jgi:large subunit ribosomal protein L2
MGKRLKQQVRGKGTPKYRAPSHRFKVKVAYRPYDDLEKTGVITGEVMGFIDDPARSGIIASVKLDDSTQLDIIAPESLAIGDRIEIGANAKVDIGNIMPLYAIPDGTYVYNVEGHPGDGGKFIRAAGAYAIIVSKDNRFVYVKMPSKKIIMFDPDARAQVGVIAGGGLKDKPLLKAGNAFHKHRARRHLWPKNRGVKMSPFDHPFGGKQHHKGKSSSVGRNAPPGRKVGHIASRQTGRGGKAIRKDEQQRGV